MPVPRIQRHVQNLKEGQRWIRKQCDTTMREVQFCVVSERPGQLEAEADVPALRRIAAPTLEELQHEAREALIDHYGAAHGVYRVRVRRGFRTGV